MLICTSWRSKQAGFPPIFARIDHNETDLEELADQTREIVANLETIKESGKAL
jgi:hypothetical protein